MEETPAGRPRDGFSDPQWHSGPLERTIGRYDTGRAGPLLIILGGIHGNEPSGVIAVRRVLQRLRTESLPLRGTLVGLAGNLKALRSKTRYLSEDLNRLWLPERFPRGSGTTGLTDEALELHALAAVLDPLLKSHTGKIVIVDLHSTSGSAPPFSIISDTIQNRRIAFAVPIPVVLGLEETIDGTTLSYFGDMGLIAIGIEGGQHDEPETIMNHEAVLWLIMTEAGLLEPSVVPDLHLCRKRLEQAAGVLPRVVEVIHRHGLSKDDNMEMVPGLRSFDTVAEGDLLARDRRGGVRAPAKGLLLFPRYQILGDDGFFITRPVNPFWLDLSAWFRFLRIGLLIRLFPGVRQADSERRVLFVDPRVARWFTVQVFHLLGYRRQGTENGMLRFNRRPEGRQP